MSDETKAADKAMDECLNEMNRVYAADAGVQPGVVTGYLMVYATQRWLDDGQPVTTYGIVWPSDRRMAHYHGLGLLAYATDRINRDYADRSGLE